MASGQIHIAILNPGVEITPLRLRGWLQKEAAVINNRANPGDGAILRLFLTRKLRYGLPGKKLDAILQALTEKYPAVLRIEVQLIEAPLTADEMAEQTRIANADTPNASRPRRWRTRRLRRSSGIRLRARWIERRRMEYGLAHPDPLDFLS